MGNEKAKPKAVDKEEYHEDEMDFYHPSDLTNYSSFYYFTEWATRFPFYSATPNKGYENFRGVDDNLVTMQKGPNEFNVFKVIKAIDKLPEKDYSIFNTVEMMLVHNDDDSENEQLFKEPKMVSWVVERLKDVINLNSKKFSKIVSLGPPNNLRWMMWMSVVDKAYYDVLSNFGVPTEKIYESLVSHKMNEKYKSQITQFSIEEDLGDYQEIIVELWAAIFSYFRVVPFNCLKSAIYAIIISNYNVFDSFLFLVHLLSPMYGLKLIELYDDQGKLGKNYHIMKYITEQIIKDRLPKIYKVLQELNVKPDEWFGKWYQTFFTNFPIGICVRFWDCIVAYGKNYFHNIVLGILKFYNDKILEINDKEKFLELFDKDLDTEEEAITFREKVVLYSKSFTIKEKYLEKIVKGYDEFNESNFPETFDSINIEITALSSQISCEGVMGEYKMLEELTELCGREVIIDPKELEVNMEYAALNERDSSAVNTETSNESNRTVQTVQTVQTNQNCSIKADSQSKKGLLFTLSPCSSRTDEDKSNSIISHDGEVDDVNIIV